MQILIAFLVGAAVGLIVHFLVPLRPTRGIALAPVFGAVLSGASWLILTWAGVGSDTLWPWLAALVAPLLVAPVLVVLGRARLAHDERERIRLRVS